MYTVSIICENPSITKYVFRSNQHNAFKSPKHDEYNKHNNVRKKVRTKYLILCWKKNEKYIKHSLNILIHTIFIYLLYNIKLYFNRYHETLWGKKTISCLIQKRFFS